jgi:large-conductance mechanosensitive channel
MDVIKKRLAAKKEAAPAKPTTEELLTQIRDLLSQSASTVQPGGHI